MVTPEPGAREAHRVAPGMRVLPGTPETQAHLLPGSAKPFLAVLGEVAGALVVVAS